MASRYFRNTGNVNWGTTTNWSATDGGASVGAIPVAADDVFFTALSGSCTVNSSTRDCHSVDCTGYTGTLTMSNSIQLNGAGGGFVLSPTMTLSGSGGISSLQNGGTSTWTSNGKIWNGGTVTLNGSSGPTFTFTDDWTMGGFVMGGGAKTINGVGRTISLTGTFSGAATVSGNVTIKFIGTGNWSGTSAISLDFIIDTAGTITVTANINPTGNITRVNGTVNTGSTTLNLTANSILDTAGITWNNVTVTGSMTLTLNSLFTVSGILSLSNNNIVFAGTSGFSVNTLTDIAVTSVNRTFVAGVIYTITNLIQAVGTLQTAHTVYKSASVGTKTNLILNSGAVCKLGYVDFTDVNASGGRRIDTFNGVLSNTDNISNYQDPTRTLALSFAA